MGQGFKLDQDLLGFETFLVPFAGRQALFILLDLDFHATTAFIVEVDISQQDSLGILYLLFVPIGQPQYIDRKQSRKNDAIAPLTVFLATAHSDALDRAAIQVGFGRHPADLAIRISRIVVVDPSVDTLCLGFGTDTRIILAMHLIASFQEPIDVLDTPAARVDPQDGSCSFALIQF